ncbi:ABC transporter ATP-binding protein [Breoghania sp. L-A4]|uniref:ABC transporter ATP-binding protein n=1 Tax=Breoghania sp. L-A4 TaxID=2304600 RepID=UPI000E35D74D|nr:ABC transporter ATP-binding protein [Breoghania sp. L-A4]AXS41521.1 ABC transporter ATP-binding protein [Breoghania sp. L-A4]
MTSLRDEPDYLIAKSVSKSFGGTRVLENLDLHIGRGEFVSLLGPSGCGKTTLLRMIAGLLPVDDGSITLGGKVISGLPPHQRNVGVVFQNYALFPHLTVRDNIAFGLRARGGKSADVEKTVSRFLDLIKLPDIADRYPSGLSGGQQQRVAVARALAPHPDILLLDEPFSALDRKLREGMQIELKALLRDLGITSVFVTHDQDEALVMSDRIAVMNAGVIEQFGTPSEIYRTPRSRFVLDFIGASSQLAGTVSRGEGGRLAVSVGDAMVTAPGHFRTGADVVVAVRPEDISIRAAGDTPDGLNAVPVVLKDRIYVGARTLAHFSTSRGERLSIELAPDQADGLEPGGTFAAVWNTDKTFVFPGERP